MKLCSVSLIFLLAVTVPVEMLWESGSFLTNHEFRQLVLEATSTVTEDLVWCVYIAETMPCLQLDSFVVNCPMLFSSMQGSVLIYVSKLTTTLCLLPTWHSTNLAVLELPTTATPVVEGGPEKKYLTIITNCIFTLSLSQILVRISFHWIYQDSPNVSFSLACNSSSGPATRVMWTRDGLLLDNTSRLVPINASSSSYTNVLTVNGRKPGTYGCQIGGPNNQMLTSTNFSVQGEYTHLLS